MGGAWPGLHMLLLSSIHNCPWHFPIPGEGWIFLETFHGRSLTLRRCVYTPLIEAHLSSGDQIQNQTFLDFEADFLN